MRSFWLGSAMALIAASFCMALGAPAQAGCVELSGTADGFDKETTRSVAHNSRLPITSSSTRRKRDFVQFTVSAKRASPQPYWRSSVSENMFCFNIWCGV